MSVTRSIIALAIPSIMIAACSADLKDMNGVYAVSRSWCEKRASCGDPTVGDQEACVESVEKQLTRNGTVTVSGESKDKMFECAETIRNSECPTQFTFLPTVCSFGASATVDSGGGFEDTGGSDTFPLSCSLTGTTCTTSTGARGSTYACNRQPSNCSRIVGKEVYCCTDDPR